MVGRTSLSPQRTPARLRLPSGRMQPSSGACPKWTRLPACVRRTRSRRNVGGNARRLVLKDWSCPSCLPAGTGMPSLVGKRAPCKKQHLTTIWWALYVAMAARALPDSCSWCVVYTYIYSAADCRCQASSDSCSLCVALQRAAEPRAEGCDILLAGMGQPCVNSEGGLEVHSRLLGRLLLSPACWLKCPWASSEMSGCSSGPCLPQCSVSCRHGALMHRPPQVLLQRCQITNTWAASDTIAGMCFPLCCRPSSVTARSARWSCPPSWST